MILARAQENAGRLETVHVASGRDYFLLPTISSEIQGTARAGLDTKEEVGWLWG